MISVNEDMKQAMLQRGISALHPAPFGLPEDCTFEPPCSIKWMGIDYCLTMGAFSYAVSGYYFGADIARYCSIGESVQVGRGSHPVHCGSTSPLFYTHHSAVFDRLDPRAADYEICGPYLWPKRVRIGNDVYIGHGAFLMPDITIGDGAIIGAMAVVTKDVPPYAIVAGSPARVVKMRFPDALIERYLKVQWWRYAFWDLRQCSITDPEQFLDAVEEKIAGGMQEYRPDWIPIQSLVPGG
ncbi:CatB-related O-acetyltransferase [Methylobacterium sp. J-070]|uniref:CatB-related O-acetyltransferase n=1 Tax=Methylobacterium sp. J-070 TaxID=2836650 RepID=UPI002443939B|nr:CatB-related O-acetyltransferase [Methylobacterium sp. J-070]